MKHVLRATQILEEWDTYIQYATTTRQLLSQATADAEVLRALETRTEDEEQKLTNLNNTYLPELERRWKGMDKVLKEKLGAEDLESALEKFEKAVAAVEVYKNLRKQFMTYRAMTDLEIVLGISQQKRRELEEALAKISGDVDEQEALVRKLVEPVTLVVL